MSISNLLTSNVKSWQILNVEQVNLEGDKVVDSLIWQLGGLDYPFSDAITVLKIDDVIFFELKSFLEESGFNAATNFFTTSSGIPSNWWPSEVVEWPFTTTTSLGGNAVAAVMTLDTVGIFRIYLNTSKTNTMTGGVAYGFSHPFNGSYII